MRFKRVYLVNDEDFNNLIEFATKTKDLISRGHTSTATIMLDDFIKIVKRTQGDRNGL